MSGSEFPNLSHEAYRLSPLLEIGQSFGVECSVRCIPGYKHLLTRVSLSFLSECRP